MKPVDEIAGQINRLNKTVRRNMLFLCVLFFLFIVFQGITYLSELVTLFAGVLFACYILLGPVNWLEAQFKKIVPDRLKSSLNKLPSLGLRFRLVSVVVVFVGFVLLLVVATSQIFPVVITQVGGFVKALPSYYSQVQKQLDYWSKIKLSSIPAQPKAVMTILDNETQAIPSHPVVQDQENDLNRSLKASETALGQLVLFFRNVATSAFSNVLDFLTTSLTGLVYGLTGFVLLFYFLLDGESLRRGFIGLMNPKVSKKMARYLDATHFLFFTLLKVQVMTAILSGAMLYGVYLLLDVDFSGFLSFFFAICSVIPAIGPWVGALPSAVVLIFSGEPITMLVIFSLLAGFYVIKQRWFLPRIYGGRLDIHPVLILLSLLICTQLIGALGFLLAIPLVCLISGIHSCLYPVDDSPQLD